MARLGFPGWLSPQTRIPGWPGVGEGWASQGSPDSRMAGMGRLGFLWVWLSPRPDSRMAWDGKAGLPRAAQTPGWGWDGKAGLPRVVEA